jgi:alpha-amylase
LLREANETMGVILQATYKFKNGHTVPSPSDGHSSVPWWWDHLAAQASSFRQAGFTAVLLPPALKSSAGASRGADGYGVFDDYDLGNKNQVGSLPTRFGTREQLQRCTAIMRANGLDIYLDIVLHQRDGGNNFVYSYAGANGKPAAGRFSKHPTCFVPNVPRDSIAGPVADDFAFGDELAPINALPQNYVSNGLIDAVDWQTKAVDGQGYRIDDTKGMAVAFVSRFLNSKSMAGKFAVGEYFDGNPDTLDWWSWNSGMNGRACTFDFRLRFTLAAMCNNASRWDMSQLDHPGYVGRDPDHAVTFVENHDTDLSSPVIWNKLLGYAYLLTSEGYPCVYYKDYSPDSGCYGLKPVLDTLIWIHEHLAGGSTVFRRKEFQFVAYERMAWPNLLVGLNNDIYDGWKTITVQTAFGPNVHLHDYSGHAGDVWTDDGGSVTIGIPQNNNGAGYVCYSRAELDKPNEVHRLETTQVFEGADDLDIGPAVPHRALKIARVWCDAGFPITLEPESDATGLTFSVFDQLGRELLLDKGKAHTNERGWHTLSVISTNVAPTAFKLAVTWTSTQTL